MMRNHWCLGLVAAVAMAVGASAATAQAVAARLDSIAGSGVVENRTAGLVAAVVKGSDTLLLKGYGRAVVEWDVAMPADAMFEVGSVAKQFTAVVILQLRDEGKLGLDDDITKWLPDFDTRGNAVPLRRLLDHTSGIVGLTEMPEFGTLVTNARFPRDSAYALIKRYPFQFPTGTAQIYNNSAFWLLGLVIERASGLTYEEYVERKLFEPLGMTRSMYCNSSENVPRRAFGYAVQNGVVRRAPTNVHTWPYAAGSICSTAGDLVKWLQSLHGGKVLSARSYAELITPAKLADGTPLWYSMGLVVNRNVRGVSYIGHGGAIGGFMAEAGWYPDAQLAVVVLSNSNGNLDPSAVAAELSAEVLPGVRPTLSEFRGDASPLVGTYRGPSRGRDMVVQVTRTAEGVAFSINGAAARSLPWVEGWTFRQSPTGLMTFAGRAPAGPATELRVQTPSGYYVLVRQ